MATLVYGLRTINLYIITTLLDWVSILLDYPYLSPIYGKTREQVGTGDQWRARKMSHITSR